MNERGASFTELLAVMSIITIVCVLSGPQWLALAARLDGRGVTAEVAGELRLARQLAIARQERIRVVFDGEGTMMRTELHDGPPTLLRAHHFAGRGTVLESSSNGLQIVFHPSGRSATATTIVLSDRNHKKRTITVGITGKVSAL